MNPSQNLALNLALSPNLTPDQELIPDQDLTLNQDIIPNQINDISICVCKVKEFLQKNSKEHLITAARIYNLPESTL